jgi:hypothetical protein
MGNLESIGLVAYSRKYCVRNNWLLVVQICHGYPLCDYRGLLSRTIPVLRTREGNQPLVLISSGWCHCRIMTSTNRKVINRYEVSLRAAIQLVSQAAKLPHVPVTPLISKQARGDTFLSQAVFICVLLTIF